MSLIKLISTTFFFLFFYLSLEIFKRKWKVHAEYTRKIAHFGSGIAAIFFSSYLNVKEFIFVTLIFLGVFLVARFKKLFKAINISHRQTYGEVVYPLGLIVLATSLYHIKKLFVIGVLILAVPDTLAGWIGFKLNKKGKSVIGSLVYFLTASIILALNLGLKTSILLAFILTLVEFISPLGLDNLSIPLAYHLLTFFFSLR